MAGKTHEARALVLGAAGKLGSFVRRAWSANPSDGFAPVCVARGAGADIQWAPDESHAPLPEADTVIALWGVTRGSRAELAGNTDLALAAREVARRTGARRLIHLSSVAVYGPGRDMAEDHPLTPVTAYGRAKRDMEQALARAPLKGVRETCLRLANVVGADSLKDSLYPGARVRMDRFADGQGPVRSYMAPGDLARGLVALSRMAPGDLPARLNMAAPVPVAMADLVQAAGATPEWQAAPGTAVQTVTVNVARMTALLPGLCFCDTAAAMIADLNTLRGRA